MAKTLQPRPAVPCTSIGSMLIGGTNQGKWSGELSSGNFEAEITPYQMSLQRSTVRIDMIVQL